MANQLTVSASLSYSNVAVATIAKSLSKTNALFSVTGVDYVLKSMAVPTTITAMDLGSVGTPGWFFIQNDDPTNYVQLYASISDGANPLLTLNPGEFAMGRFAAAAPAVKANTAPLEIEYLIIAN